MKSTKILIACTLFCVASFSSYAQHKKETTTTTVKVDVRQDSIINFKKPQKAVTHGSVTVEGNRINYEAVAGTLILKNELDTPTISISYVAYFKDDEKDASQRPITFVYKDRTVKNHKLEL